VKEATFNNSMRGVIRVIIHCYREENAVPHHEYQNGAQALRPDLAAVKQNEPMAQHTTFKTGGPADFYWRPGGTDVARLCHEAREKAGAAGKPLFVLGGGSNLIVGDRGLRAFVLDMGSMNRVSVEGDTLTAQAGALSDAVAEAAAQANLTGAEFLAGLPGTVGGAALMNARCWDREIADILQSVLFLDSAGETRQYEFNAADFAYKKSPFQAGGKFAGVIVLSVSLSLKVATSVELIYQKMENFRKARQDRSQFRFPSAGSVFKNNRAFGKPTGQIIEELGLRGTRRGGAQIAPWHGNFIINIGGATSADFRALVELAQNTARDRLGIELDPEVVFAGE
jgi:UDP-N-acetylmuramate dehydrogenase